MRSWRAVLLALTLVAVVRPRDGSAGFTTPTLVLSAASGAGVDGTRSVAVEGAFDFPNLVQADYPLELVVFQGTRFARYPMAGVAITGNSSTLADGQLTATDLDALLGDGAPAPPGVAIVTVAAHEIRVALPPSFTAGPTTAQLFTILGPERALSNPVGFTLP